MKSTRVRRPEEETEESNSTTSSCVVTLQTRVPDPQVDPLVCSFSGGLPAALKQSLTTEAGTTTASRRQEPPRFLLRRKQQQPSQVSTTNNSSQKKANYSYLLLGKDKTCLYTAAQAEDGVHKNDSSKPPRRKTRLAVGVYDKLENTVTLYPAACDGHVFALQQSVPSYTSSTAASQQTESATRIERDSRNSHRLLFDEFGSAKKRKALDSREANRVESVDSVVGAGSQLKSFLSGSAHMSESNRNAIERKRQQSSGGGNDDDDSSNEQEGQSMPQSAADITEQEWRKSFLPAWNSEAKEPGSVYSASAMAGTAVWESVSRVVDAVVLQNAAEHVVADLLREAPDRDRSVSHLRDGGGIHKEWMPSVQEILRNISSDAQTAGFQYKCAILLNHFMSFYLKGIKKIAVKAPPSDDNRVRWFGLPVVVVNRFLELFMTAVDDYDNEHGGEPRFVMSQGQKSKCQVHMLLLSLIAAGGKSMKASDIGPIAKDLQIEVKDASHLLRLAGCKVSKKKENQKRSTMAYLTTPLKLPPMPQGYNRRRTR